MEPWKEGVDGSRPSGGLKYLQIAYFCCVLRRVARDHYGGGQRGSDLQGFWRRPGGSGYKREPVREHGLRFGQRPRQHPDGAHESSEVRLQLSLCEGQAPASSSASARPSAYTAA